MSYILNAEERKVVEDNPKLVAEKVQFYLDNIMHMTSDKADMMGKKSVALEVLRKKDPLYGHNDESLMELYSELKAIEDAESGADREYDYEGTDELYKTAEEIKEYVLKYNMY